MQHFELPDGFRGSVAGAKLPQFLPRNNTGIQFEQMNDVAHVLALPRGIVFERMQFQRDQMRDGWDAQLAASVVMWNAPRPHFPERVRRDEHRMNGCGLPVALESKFFIRR